jgi:GT2 family glycosyltransferase
MMDLSIVIASYETPDLLLACLDSVGQSLCEMPRRTVEVIVVDNGSRDCSAARAAGSKHNLRIVASVRNRGFASAMNRGLRLARGRTVLLLNSDVEVNHALLEGALERFERDAEIGVLGPSLVHPDGRAQRSVHLPPSLGSEFASERVLRWVQSRSKGSAKVRNRNTAEADTDKVEEDLDVEAVRGAVFFLRATLVDAIGGLDEGYFFFLEETDFCTRVRAAGHRVVYAPELLASHRLGASSKRRAPLATRIEYHRSLDRFLRLHHGEAAAAIARSWRALRQLAALPLLALAGIFDRGARVRLKERAGLVLWHLRGRPESPTLAEVLAEQVGEPHA